MSSNGPMVSWPAVDPGSTLTASVNSLALLFSKSEMSYIPELANSVSYLAFLNLFPQLSEAKKRHSDCICSHTLVTFLVAVIKYLTRSNLKAEDSFWLSVGGDAVPHGREGMESRSIG